METEDGTVEEEDDDEDEEMTRDEFNLNKMIVIVTFITCLHIYNYTEHVYLAILSTSKPVLKVL
jgi:hypothetical protein